MSQGICSIEECTTPARVRGWCSKHYSRWAKWGDPTYLGPIGRPIGPDSRKAKYPVKDLVCHICGEKFRGRHGRRCRRCIYVASQGRCVCGKPIHPKSTTCQGCRDRKRGAENPGWKGGRFVAKSGYVMVYAPDHPGRLGVYVDEHRLVMESMLGRYLLENENVHHRNGVKADNRPENLELWVVSQPPGQRAIDLLAWAREIIATYEPVEPVIASPV